MSREGAALAEVDGFDFSLGAAEVNGVSAGQFVGAGSGGEAAGYFGCVAGEQVVLEAEEKLGAAGLALAGGAADELAVDPRAFVAFEADDMKPAGADDFPRAPGCARRGRPCWWRW